MKAETLREDDFRPIEGQPAAHYHRQGNSLVHHCICSPQSAGLKFTFFEPNITFGVFPSFKNCINEKPECSLSYENDKHSLSGTVVPMTDPQNH